MTDSIQLHSAGTIGGWACPVNPAGRHALHSRPESWFVGDVHYPRNHFHPLEERLMSRSFRAVSRSTVLCVVAVTAFCLGMWPPPAKAQPAARPAASEAPVPLAPATPKSPQMQPDETIIFRLAMPNAAKVELHLEGAAHPFPMAKGADAVWSVTVPKLAPQYYSYTFDVDGTALLDPHNVTIKPSFFNTQNVFLVPGQPPMPWEPSNVPHGALHHHYYRSNIVGINSEYYVYTPPNFESRRNQKYPVLYLFFFFNDTATTEIYTLSLHDALPGSAAGSMRPTCCAIRRSPRSPRSRSRSEDHTSELQSQSKLVGRLLLEKKEI